jgi:hypothetical protein
LTGQSSNHCTIDVSRIRRNATRRAQSLYCAAAIKDGAMRFAYCALRAGDVWQETRLESGGYWIARSSRAMTLNRYLVFATAMAVFNAALKLCYFWLMQLGQGGRHHRAETRV